jgi:hypothetical protein
MLAKPLSKARPANAAAAMPNAAAAAVACEDRVIGTLLRKELKSGDFRTIELKCCLDGVARRSRGSSAMVALDDTSYVFFIGRRRKRRRRRRRKRRRRRRR